MSRLFGWLLCRLGYHDAEPPLGSWMLNLAYPGSREQVVSCQRCSWTVLLVEDVAR